MDGQSVEGKVGQVQDQIAVLSNRISDLTKIVNEVENRLLPIVRPASIKEESINTGPDKEGELVSLAERLRCLNLSLQENIEKLNSVVSRCEI